MKKIRNIAFAVMFALVLSLYGCMGNQIKISDDLQLSFFRLIPVADLNKSLRVTIIPDGQNENKFGSDIEIHVENLSEQHIFFTGDASLPRVFIIRENKWTEIKNHNDYYGDGWELSPKGERYPNPSLFATWVRPILEPNLENKRQQEIVRILIVGELAHDKQETGIPVGAYVDLLVNP